MKIVILDDESHISAIGEETIIVNDEDESIDALEPLRECKDLQYLDFTSNTKVASLEPLSGCKNLEYIDFNWNNCLIDILNCSNDMDT